MELNQLKTFEDACKVERIDPEKFNIEFSFMPEKHRKSMQAYMRLIIIVQAANRIANEGNEWMPNWDKPSEYKYQPWFWMNGGSSGFRFGDCDSWAANSDVGSRLCFISSEVAEYVANQFLEEYRSFMTL